MRIFLVTDGLLEISKKTNILTIYDYIYIYYDCIFKINIFYINLFNYPIIKI